MQSKKTLILAQVFISAMMAFMMSGIFSFAHFGLTSEWLVRWSQTFIIAWPLAFVLSLGVGPLSFYLANKLTS